MTADQRSPEPTRGVVGEFFGGVGVLASGLRLWITSPRLMLLGAIPALLVGAILLTAIIILAVNAAAIAEWATPFASTWDEPLRSSLRVAGAFAIVILAVVLAVVSYAAITLAVGSPFYERIWEKVEERLGDAPPTLDTPLLTSVRRGILDALRILLLTIAIGILLFAGGLIPVVGQVVVPVLGAATGGWILALELTGSAFDARGFTLADRRRLLGTRRARTLGFGVAAYLLLLIPIVSVIMMPAAAAAATVLARSALPASADSAAAHPASTPPSAAPPRA